MTRAPWKTLPVTPHKERWHRVNGWPYEVSDHGRVRSLRSGDLLSPALNSYGKHEQYLRVTLYRGRTHAVAHQASTRQSFYVHRLVATAFVGGQTRRRCLVHHKDNNPWNNHHANLEWLTPKEHARTKRRQMLTRYTDTGAPF